MGPSKSTAVLFTNKRKVKKFPITMDGEVIPYKDQVKYLGVILGLWVKVPRFLSASLVIYILNLQNQRE